MPTDLWPDFPVETPATSIRDLLAQAGSGIESKTQGRVLFGVNPPEVGDDFRSIVVDGYLEVPEIGYGYPFVRVITEGPNPFPAVVVFGEKQIPVATQDDFFHALSSVFHSDTVKELVLNLLSLSKPA